MKRSITAVLAVIMILFISYFTGTQINSFPLTALPSSSPEIVKQNKIIPNPSIPDENSPMQTSTYWIQQLQHPQDIILSPDKIQAFNKNIRNILQGDIYSLSSFPQVLSYDAVLHEIDKQIPTAPRYVNGNKVNQAYWKQLQQNLNASAIQDVNPVHYAISVKRTNMKEFPTSDVVSDSPDDPGWDQFQNSAVLANEPLLLLHQSSDGKWYYAYMYNCYGWVEASNIAICESRQDWLDAQKHENFLVVTADKMNLGKNTYAPELSEMEVTMGTILPLADKNEIPKGFNKQDLAKQYIIKMPARNDLGEIFYTFSSVPISNAVHKGFLPYTRENIINQAFKMNGDKYGWGGMSNLRDCSSFVLELYRCFGWMLPRNSDAQGDIPTKVVQFSGKSTLQKQRLLDNLLPGSLLTFPGHVMIYLGEVDNRYWVISAMSSYLDNIQDPSNPKVVRIRQVQVNDLNLLRTTGKSWMSILSMGVQLN